MPSLFDTIFRRGQEPPAIPVCPDHEIEMRLRGHVGKATRFTEQSESEYTLIYFCPEPGCNHIEDRVKVRTQVPVPGETPERPSFARPGSQSSL